MLHQQYRMHPGICEFPSTTFYGGMLQADPSCPPDMRLPCPRCVRALAAAWVGGAQGLRVQMAQW